MPENSQQPMHLSESPEAAAVEHYRSVSGLAVVSLLLGLLSPLALIDPIAWLLPLIAIIVAGIAMLRIHGHADSMIGKKAAFCGILLAVISGSTAITHWFTFRVLIERQARPIAMAWFDFLVDDQPLKAYQMTLAPGKRKPLDGDLLSTYQHDADTRIKLEGFLQSPLIRTMLALGDKADVRFYECTGVWGQTGKENVAELFSISFEEPNGKKKTFFASVVLRKSPPKKHDEINWVIADIKGGVEPPSGLANKATNRAVEPDDI